MPFEDVQNPPIPDWNCIMHDLINVGGGIVPGRINRGNYLRDVVNIFNDFGEYENYGVEIEDATGLPMMFIIVKDKEHVRGR